MNDLKIHSAADIFPMMKGAKFAAFVEDIRQFGQRESIKLLKGQIIDGRNRYAACKEVGIEPRFESLPDDTDPGKYVVSINIRRRQLTVAQRALVGARIAQMMKQSSLAKRAKNFQEKQGFTPSYPIGSLGSEWKHLSKAASDMVGVGKNSVYRALEILESKKSKELVELIEDGKTLNHVYSKLPKPKKEKKRTEPERESTDSQDTDEKASSEPQDERKQPDAPKTPPSHDTKSEEKIEPCGEEWIIGKPPPVDTDRVKSSHSAAKVREFVKGLAYHLSVLGLAEFYTPVLYEMRDYVERSMQESRGEG